VKSEKRKVISMQCIFTYRFSFLIFHFKKIAASGGAQAATIETIFQLFHNSSQRNEKTNEYYKTYLFFSLLTFFSQMI
jgi:hypothetical protein